jgi:hypothetical protein
MTLTEPRRHAVLISSARYDDPKIIDYTSIANSATRLDQLFHASELWDSCDLVSDPAVATDVMLPIRDAALECQQGDTLLVYFVGHAINPLRVQHSDILLALRTTIDGESWSYLSLYHVYDMMRRSRATSKILILDCCYCGAADTLSPGGDQVLTDPNWLTEEASTCVLKAARRDSVDQKVHSFLEKDPTSTYTAFSGYLISILENGIEGMRNPLQVRDVYNELRRIVPASGRHPEPELLIRNEPRIVLMENRHSGAILVAPGDPSQLARLRAATPEELADAWVGAGLTLSGLPRALIEEYFTGQLPRTDGESLGRIVHHLHTQGAADRLDELIPLARAAAPNNAGAAVRELRRHNCRTCADFAARIHASAVKALSGAALHHYSKAVSGD